MRRGCWSGKYLSERTAWWVGVQASSAGLVVLEGGGRPAKKKPARRRECRSPVPRPALSPTRRHAGILRPGRLTFVLGAGYDLTARCDSPPVRVRGLDGVDPREGSAHRCGRSESGEGSCGARL